MIKKIFTLILTIAFGISGMSIMAYSDISGIYAVTPNGTQLSYQEAQEIDLKVKNAMADAYVEQEQCTFNEISSYSVAPQMSPIIEQEYNRIVAEELVENNPRNEMTLRNIVARTFYFEVDENGIRIPIMNSEVEKIAAAKSQLATQNQSGISPYGGSVSRPEGKFTLVLSVFDNYDGYMRSVSAQARVENFMVTASDLEYPQRIGMHYGGGEALSQWGTGGFDYTGGYYTYRLGNQGFTQNASLYDHFPNAGLVLEYVLPLNAMYANPMLLSGNLYATQYGRQNQLANIGAVFLNQFLDVVPNFSISTTGISIGGSEGLGIAQYPVYSTYNA